MGFVRYILSWLWCSAESAKAGGMTHHGRIYGCPAWVCDGEEMFMAVTKVPALVVYTSVCDMIFDAFTTFMSEDQELVTPIHVGKPI